MTISERFFIAALTLFSALLTTNAEDNYRKEEAKSVYLKGVADKPCFDKLYQSRIPVLVSEPVGKARKNAVIDFELSLPSQDVLTCFKVVSAEGAEIPSQVINSGNKTEIVFLTDLRKYEQKPFLIYCGKAAVTQDSVQTARPSDLRLDETDKFYIIGNDKIEADIWRQTDRLGKINRIHIRGADCPNELSELSSGGAWYGHATNANETTFFFKPRPYRSTAKLTVNGPLKKTIEIAGKDYIVRYSFYSFSGRIDYEIVPGTAKKVGVKTAWLVGGYSALDKIFYEGSNGAKMLDGERNEILDSNDFYPRYNLREWLKEGWIAIEDASGEVTAGEFFDIGSLEKCEFLSQGMNSGESITLGFALSRPVRGALVALKGSRLRFRNEYIEWKNPPEIYVGEPQKFNDMETRVPGFVRDVTCSYKTEIHPLRDANRNDSDSAVELIKTVKRFGANAIKLDIQRRYVFPISAERLNAESPEFKTEYEKQKNYVQEICAAAHKEGLAVQFWWTGLAREVWQKNLPFNDNKMQIQLEDYLNLAGAGIDLICLETGGEFHCPDGFTGNYGAKELEKEKEFNKWTELFSKKIKDKFPAMPVEILCSGSGSLRRYVDIENKAPFIDTLQTEIVVKMTPNLTDIKYGTRYPLGVFGNDGRAIQHHFYYYSPHESYATGTMALPLMFGVKSFCSESISNRMNNSELVEITADFYRFIDRTDLKKIAAKTAPFKFAGILRDRDAFKNDIIKCNFKTLPDKMSAYESSCKEISSLKNIPFDIIDNRFCTLPELEKYKLIVIPSDPVLSDNLASEIVKYVKNGGCLITENETVRNGILAEALGVRLEKDSVNSSHSVNIKGGSEIANKFSSAVEVSKVCARVVGYDSSGQSAIFIHEFGKGKTLYSKYTLSENLISDKEKGMFYKSLIKNLIGQLPWEIPCEFDNLVDSSVLLAGNEFILGVYNPGSKPAAFKIKMNFPVKKDSYILDLRKSVRSEFGGEACVDIPAGCVGFYIVGSEKTTSVPVMKRLPNYGGAASVSGMKFAENRGGFKYDLPKQGGKVIGVFKAGSVGSQNYGSTGIYDCLSGADLKDIKIKYLNDLKESTLNNCNVVIIPNMGFQLPVNLDENWYKSIKAFVEAGGNVMLIHHAVGVDVAPPVFPEIGAPDGTYGSKAMTITKQHPVTQDIKDAPVQDIAWGFLGIQPGNDGIVLARGCADGKLLSPVLVAGKVGKGNVVLSGICFGAAGKTENGKYVKYEVQPESNLKKIFLNSVNWMLHD